MVNKLVTVFAGASVHLDRRVSGDQPGLPPGFHNKFSNL